jgi:hypothetical protein
MKNEKWGKWRKWENGKYGEKIKQKLISTKLIPVSSQYCHLHRIIIIIKAVDKLVG